MQTRAPLGHAAACLCFLLAACSGNRDNETSRNLGAGDGGRDARAERDAEDEPDGDESDAAPEPLQDASEPADATSSLDAGAAEDAASDAGAVVDSAIDAGAPQDAAPPQDATSANDAGNVIYASFAGRLVRIDPDTAQLTEIGVLRNVEDAGQTFVDVVMTWTGVNGSAWLVTSYYQTPTLATANLCTAEVQVGPRLVRPSSPNLVVEGLAMHPNGNFYVGSGNPGNPVNNPISSNLGTLDASTGAITDLGVAVTAFQGDVDMLFVRDNVLYGVDVATANNRLSLFTLNLETGKDTQVVAPTYGAMNQVPLRVAYDSSRGKAFTWRPSDRNLLTFDLDAGTIAQVGETHDAGSPLGNVPRAFFVAPLANCASTDK